MAHFLGAAGAVKFLQALQEDPEQSAAELFPAAAASNTGVFYDHNSGGARSLAEVYQRQTAMFGTDAGQPVYSAGPGYADAPADPAFADISPRDQDRLLDQATTRRREGESLSRGALESGVRDATRDLTTIGRHDGPLPGIADFTKAYGPQAGARHYADLQRVVSLGADIDAIKAMTPAEQTAWLARFTPRGDGPDPDGARDRYARARHAIALNLAFRSRDPNAYVRALNPRIDRLWQEAGNSPERLKAALSATNAAMDRLGMPVEERRLIPKAMVDQALAAFGDTGKPMVQRLAPLRAALAASADPGAQQAIFGQMVSAGLPPMLEYTAIAYARGDAALAERFATATLGSPDANGRATTSADDASFASPAAAANTTAGPAPMRTLSGPAIDLGPAAAAALGSSLTGDERTSRAETVRARMIEDAMRSNGGDRLAAIAQTDRDLASLQGYGWAPGMYMRAPMAGAGTQLAFQNTENNPAFPGATQSDGASRAQGPLPGGTSNIGKGLGAGLPGMIGGEISNSIWPQPEGGFENYPGTSIPKSYYVSVNPLSKVFVPPAITQFFVDQLKGVSPAAATLREHSLPSHTGEVNSAIKDARIQLMRAEREGDPQPYYTATSWDGLSYDIAFAPDKEADGTVTVAAIRPRGRLTNWAQQAIGQKDPMPGAWWGTPPKSLWEADAPQSDPIPIGTPGIPNASPAKEHEFPRPTWTEDDPYDVVTYDAILRSTGDRNLAHATAREVARSRRASLTASGSDGKGPPAYSSQPTPAAGQNEPYDEAEYDAAVKAGLSETQALLLARENYRKKFRDADSGTTTSKINSSIIRPTILIGPYTGLKFKIIREEPKKDNSLSQYSRIYLRAQTNTGKPAYISASLDSNANMHIDFAHNGDTKGAGTDAIAVAISHFGPENVKSITARLAEKNHEAIEGFLGDDDTDLTHATPHQIDEAISSTPAGRALTRLGFRIQSHEIVGGRVNVRYTR